MIALVVAYSVNRIIGRNNQLPWYLPADLKHFKEITKGHTVIMGRKTFDSIIDRLKQPLPDRKSVVLSSTKTYDFKNVVTVKNLSEALQLTKNDTEIYLIGGESVFTSGLEVADRIYATEIKAHVEGDTSFPEIDKSVWQEISRQSHYADDKNGHDYDFVVYERRQAK